MPLPGRYGTAHPAEFEDHDDRCRRGKTWLMNRGVHVGRVYAVDISHIAFVDPQNRAKTAVTGLNDQGVAIVDEVVDGWPVI